MTFSSSDSSERLSPQAKFDPSQFKLQLDGTFRISIRGMAAMAGVDDGGLARSLKSAADENPLPCARTLLAQGLYPADVSKWGETGGIPEDAAPFILEHYGIAAASPSPQARAVLLAFTRVGINAYLKEKLGVSQVRDTQPAYPALSPLETAERTMALVRNITSLYCELGGIDERDQLLFKDIARNQLLKLTTGSVPALPGDDEMTLSDAWMEVFQQALPRTQNKSAGTLVANAYREDFGTEPPKRQQFVDGAPRKVNSYRRSWLVETLSKFKSQLAGG